MQYVIEMGRVMEVQHFNLAIVSDDPVANHYSTGSNNRTLNDTLDSSVFFDGQVALRQNEKQMQVLKLMNGDM